MNLFYYYIGFLVLLAILILYYFFLHRKLKKGAYYHKNEIGWKKKNPEFENKIIFSAFLIGDAGAPSLDHPEPNFELLKSELKTAGENSLLCFLGDNIYPKGFPPPTHKNHARSEKRLLEQIKLAENFKGKTLFISGNHDWNKGRKGGLEALLRQQSYLEAYFKSESILLPRNGCPGPILLDSSPEIAIIVINTHWWVHSGRRPLGKENGCNIETENEFFEKLSELLQKNKHKKLLVLGHHPVYSKAYHGGKFDLKQHLFPLTEAHSSLYIPLPIAGSIYPMYRKYFGSKEDMAHPLYRNLRKRLIDIFSDYPDLVYAAGHDHNLQYLHIGKQHYIISGSGCKVTFVQKGKGAYFTHAHKGFFRLDYYEDGEVWLEAWEPGEELGKGILAYRKQLSAQAEELLLSA